MKKYVCLFAIGAFFKIAYAAEFADPIASTIANGPSLPHCVESQSDVEEIAARVKANSKSQSKYDSYRKTLESDSNVELLARLAYSETMAANCPDLKQKVGPLIVEAIANRVRIRKGDVRSVVFQRNQFASSLNIYDKSRYRDFLCPKDPQLWSAVLEKAKATLYRNSDDLSAETVNYFLYKHDPKRWPKEPWKLREDPSKASSEIRDCIKFFVVPKWK